MKLKVFCKQASEGCAVKLRLTRGEDVFGTIIELNESYVSINTAEGVVTIFEDLLAGWEIEKNVSPPAETDVSEIRESSSFEPAEPHASVIQMANQDPEESEIPASPATPEPEASSLLVHQVPSQATGKSFELILRATELRTKIVGIYEERVTRAQLRDPEPDFTFPQTDMDPKKVEVFRSQWVKVKNKYENAIRIKEMSRIPDICSHVLKPLLDQYPGIPMLEYLCGCLDLKIGNRNRAIDLIKRAALLSKSPVCWKGLAAAAPPDSPLRCIALRHFFLCHQPETLAEEWFVYLGLSQRVGDLEGMRQIVDCWGEKLQSNQDLVRVVIESMIFLLYHFGHKDESLTLAERLDNGAEVWLDGPTTLRSLCQILPPSSESIRSTEEDLGWQINKIFGQRVTAKQSKTEPTGRIISFGNQGFGFIESPDGKRYFFRLSDVEDEWLRQELKDGRWRGGLDVRFNHVSSPGHQYDRAINVGSPESMDDLLSKAKERFRMGQFSQVVGIVKKILSMEPDHQEAEKLEIAARSEMSKRVTLPLGDGPYARAKRAQIIDQNDLATEQLLREAIQKNDRKEAAIKDLASLLQKLGRVREAIDLLENYRPTFKSSESLDNILATFFQHADMHERALEILQGLSENTSHAKLPGILLRIAYSQYKLGYFDKTERTLREVLMFDPTNSTAHRWINGLEEAKKTGAYDKTETLFGTEYSLTESGAELSPLARRMLETCKYEGADPNRLQSGQVSFKDVEGLEELAKTLGTRKPRDRANYYLSAAAILHRFELDEDESRMYDYLRRYFGSMGDMAAADRKHLDVVRTYYMESLALTFEAGIEAWMTLLRFFVTFCGGPISAVSLKLHHGKNYQEMQRSYQESLRKTLTRGLQACGKTIFDRMLELIAHSPFAGIPVWQAVCDTPELLNELAGFLGVSQTEHDALKDRWQSAKHERFQQARQLATQCEVLKRLNLTVASMELLSDQLSSLRSLIWCDLDRRRLEELRKMVDHALIFCRASDFGEKENNFWLVTTSAERLNDEIDDSPTAISFESFQPIARHLRSLIEEQYADLANSAVADLKLDLIVESYPPNPSGEIRLQVQIGNRERCSPANNICIFIGPADSPDFVNLDEGLEIAASLRGGQLEVAQPRIRIKPQAAKSKAFPVTISAQFRNQLGEEQKTAEAQFTVRLYEEDEFEHIENHYAPYAGGGPVDRPEMFFGRGEMLENITNSLLSRNTGKCVVVFGQARAGKTSFLDHLALKLKSMGCLPISFSLHSIASGISEASFYYRIFQELRNSLHDITVINEPNLFPSFQDLDVSPSLMFHEYMGNFVRFKQSHGDLSGSKMVLLIDEFSDFFKYIRAGTVRKEFMKAWKAIIEKGYFSSVLIGQDIMPAFKDEFANEFGVTEDVRINYLTEAEAKRMIEEPIGASRYIGKAVEHIISMTDGSPFYTMMFCSRLVDYMNRTKSAWVTVADIAKVKQEMIRGDHRLTWDKFENLLSAATGNEDWGIDPRDTLNLCTNIALKAQDGWCSRASLEEFSGDLDILLTDLDNRDVVECKGDSYRLRVGLFHEWLLVHGIHAGARV